jgi:nucleoside-triphosphatase THEP1
MTIPAQQTTAPAGQARSRHSATPGFTRPPEVPWSLLGPQFIDAWAPKPDPGEPFEGEHMEVSGQSGSGKSYTLATLLHTRALKRNTVTIYVCTKQDDRTVHRLAALGWPICSTLAELRRHRQAIFWPQTTKLGMERKAFHEAHIYHLLNQVWVPEANTTVVFDEIGYVESLSQRLKELIQMYWREARALGISVVASKQRPVGVSRDQHSESRWKIVFPPGHHDDMEVFAQLLGRPADWQPVLESLDQTLRQFILRNSFTRDTYISWIDFQLESLPLLPKQQQTPSEQLYGRRRSERVR